MNREEAQRLVEEALDRMMVGDCVVLEDETIERSWGWVFFYQSRAFVESGDDAEMLAGNSPVIVNRYTGELVYTGTAYDIEEYLQEYETGLSGRGLQ